MLRDQILIQGQDGPSLESSSYLNVTLRYLGPWDPWTLDLGTLGLPPPPQLPPHTSSYLLLSFPPTLLRWYDLVWGYEIVIGDGPGPELDN